MKKIPILLNLRLLILLVFSSCNSAEKIDYNDYYKGRFEAILEESFIKSDDIKTNLFIIPITQCNSCDIGTYDIVKSYKSKINNERFILLFITNDTLNSDLINEFKNTYNFEVYKMSTEDAHKKNLYFLEAMYLQILNSKVIEYKVL
jgi:hypothetical protein